MKRSFTLIFLGAALVVVGLSSYRIGRDRAMAEAAASAAQPKKAGQAADVSEEAVSSRPPAEMLSLTEKLKHTYSACPSAEHDWILRGQTAAMLATMTTAELKQLLDELTGRDLSGNPVRWGDQKLILAGDALREWSRRDPVAACTAMAPPSALDDARMEALKDWLLRDPRAVERWMNSGGDAVPADLRKAWLSERVKTDPYDAVQQLAKLTPEHRESSLLDWSTASALLPAQRQALLEVVKDDPQLLKKCAGRMADALVDRSVDEAYQFVDSLKLNEETSTSLDDRIFVKWGMKDPQVAFAEWAKQQQTRLPENFLHVLDNWSMNSPGAEQAIEWLSTVDAGPVKEQIETHFIEELTSGDRFDQALQMSLAMENREEGKSQALRVIATLKQKFPGAEKELSKILREGGMKME